MKKPLLRAGDKDGDTYPINRNGLRIAEAYSERTQELIIRAVNAFQTVNIPAKPFDLIIAIRRAIKTIGGLQWQPCDDGTGEECKGEECSDANHRALAILENAIRGPK